MHAPEVNAAERPRAPAPQPSSEDFGRRALIRASRDNAIAIWRREHFERAVVALHPKLGDVIICNDPDVIRHVLVDNHANYPKDPFQRAILARGFGEALLTATGEDWKVSRRLMASAFSAKGLSAFAEPMRERTESLVDTWTWADGRVVDIAAAMTRLAFDILDEALFSRAMGGHALAFFEAIASYSDAQGGREAEAALRRVRPSLRAIVAERRERPTEGPPAEDLLTLLLKADDGKAGGSSTDAAIEANLLFFVAAGHETSASALTWALYLLFSTPDILESVREEADAAARSALPASQWLDTMDVARAVAEETLRLYPSAPLLSRAVTASETVAGHLLPRGARIIIAPWILHRHRLLWTRPDQFVPERFFPGARDDVGRYAYLPFGAGPRSCLGARFALQQMVMVIATAARSCDMAYAGDEPPMPVQRITLRPRAGMPMRIVRRQGARPRKNRSNQGA